MKALPTAVDSRAWLVYRFLAMTAARLPGEPHRFSLWYEFTAALPSLLTLLDWPWQPRRLEREELMGSQARFLAAAVDSDLLLLVFFLHSWGVSV